MFENDNAVQPYGEGRAMEQVGYASLGTWLLAILVALLLVGGFVWLARYNAQTMQQAAAKAPNADYAPVAP